MLAKVMPVSFDLSCSWTTWWSPAERGAGQEVRGKAKALWRVPTESQVPWKGEPAVP